jgi:hypothetical protein
LSDTFVLLFIIVSKSVHESINGCGFASSNLAKNSIMNELGHYFLVALTKQRK